MMNDVDQPSTRESVQEGFKHTCELPANSLQDAHLDAMSAAMTFSPRNKFHNHVLRTPRLVFWPHFQYHEKNTCRCWFPSFLELTTHR